MHGRLITHPTPVRMRLSLTQDGLGKPIPIGRVLALGMKTWRSEELSKYFAPHLKSVIELHVCLIETDRTIVSVQLAQRDVWILISPLYGHLGTQPITHGVYG